MPATRAMVGLGGLVALAVVGSACGAKHSTSQGNNGVTSVDAGQPPVDAGMDAGVVDDAGTPPDAGMPDAGMPDAGMADAGMDAGTGQFTMLTQGPPLPAPDELIHDGNGLPDSFIDAQHDAAGNVWVVTPSHLFLRRSGFMAWESFGQGEGLSGQEIMSVGGSVGGTAWVGYSGMGWGDDDDPQSWWETGGADKVELTTTGIKVTHYALVSPPGTYSQYPQGRYKLRHTMRVYPTKTGQFAGDAWFGCNHGVGEVNAAGEVIEHQHPLFCVWDPSINDCSTTHEGYVPAVGFFPNGNVLMGGSYGIMSLNYNDGKKYGDFWGDQPLHNFSLFHMPLSSDLDGSEDIVGVAVAPDGTVWAASHHSGLAHLHADEKAIDIFQEAQGLPTNDIEDMAIDSAGNAWLATTEHGLIRLNLATGVWQQASGLTSDVTRRVMFEQTNTASYVTAVVSGGIAVYNIKPTP